MRRFRAIVLFSAILAVAVTPACKNKGTKKTKDNLDPPAELTDVAAKVTVTKLWQVDAGNGVGNTGGATRATIAGDRVYLADPDNGVMAVALDSGKRLWASELDQEVVASAGVGEGVVAVGTLDGQLIALDETNGAEKWRAVLSSEVMAAPAVAESVVTVRSHDGRLYGFDLANGSRRWVFDRSLPTITLRGNGAPIVRNGTAYVGYDNGKFYAVDVNDGSLKWEQTLAVGEGRFELDRMNDLDGDLAWAESRVIAAAFNGRVTALQPENGRALWDRDLSSYGGVASDGFKVVLADVKGAVNAMDASNGASLWKNDALQNRWLTTPAIVGKYAVVGDFDGYVHWLDLDDGSIAAREKVGDTIRATPQVSGNLVLVTAVDGETTAFRVGD